MRVKYLVFILLSIFSLNNYASEFTVNNIKIFGLQKIDEGVVLSAIPFGPGNTFDTDETSNYIKLIYKTGYFKSISINRKNNDVYIYVKEKPSIASIEIIGNDSFESEKLDKALEDIGIKEGGTYDEFVLDRLTDELENQYLSQGKYSVRVDTDVKALERNRVGIVIKISEGQAAKIKQIKIIGNNSFSDSELLEDFTLTEGTLLSWVTFSDRYSKQKLAGDLEKLKSFYLNRGYLNFTINDARISITPDKKNVYITIEVTEGDVYKYGNIKSGGRRTLTDKSIANLITLKPNDTYSEREVSTIETALLTELGRNGYLYAKVDINKKINPVDKSVDVTYFIESGKRVYVRRIIFEGNIRTQDEVLRREILQMESAFVSKEKIELSKQRIAQLGYIKDINIETIPVPGSDDQVDLKYTMSEASTGHFNGSIGYMEKEGFMFNLGLSQDNFIGSGKSVSINFNKSKAATSTSVSYFDPYFTIDGIGLGYNLFYNKTNLKELNITDYRINVYGLDLRLSVPIALYDIIHLSLGAQNKDLQVNESPADNLPSINKFITKHTDKKTGTKKTDFNLLPIGASWVHNGLDRALFPTSGWNNQLSAHIMVPGSDLHYYMAYNSTRVYLPVYDEIVLYFRGNIAYGSSYNKDGGLPFFENYFGGGVGTIRGFEQNSLGKKESITINNSTRTNVIGGNSMVFTTAELYIPRFFATNIAWRPSIFVDAGNVYRGRIEVDDVRVSTGVSLQWLSPMGPLSVSYALPLRKFDGDQLKPFNFNVGTTF